MHSYTCALFCVDICVNVCAFVCVCVCVDVFVDVCMCIVLMFQFCMCACVCMYVNGRVYGDNLSPAVIIYQRMEITSHYQVYQWLRP